MRNTVQDITNEPDAGGSRSETPTMSDSDRESVITALAEDMTELFHGYIAGDVAFDELTFEMYDTLQTLHAIATGDFTIEYEYEDAEDPDDLAEGNGRVLHG